MKEHQHKIQPKSKTTSPGRQKTPFFTKKGVAEATGPFFRPSGVASEGVVQRQPVVQRNGDGTDGPILNQDQGAGGAGYGATAVNPAAQPPPAAAGAGAAGEVPSLIRPPSGAGAGAGEVPSLIRPPSGAGGEVPPLVRPPSGAAPAEPSALQEALGGMVEATGKAASPFNPGIVGGVQGAISAGTEGHLSQVEGSVGTGVNEALMLVSGARVVKAGMDLYQNPGNSSARAELVTGIGNTVKSGAGMTKTIAGTVAGTSSNVASVAGPIAGVAGAATGTFVAGRNIRKSIKAGARYNRLRQLGSQTSPAAEQVREMGAKKSLHKAIATGATASAAAASAAGAGVLLFAATNPVGWALAIGGAAVGLGIGLYRLGRWWKKKQDKVKEAKELHRLINLPDNSLERIAAAERIRAAAERLRGLGFSPAEIPSVTVDQIMGKIRDEKAKAAKILFDTYKEAFVDPGGTKHQLLSAEQSDAIKVVEAMWGSSETTLKKLRNKVDDGYEWKLDGQKEILRKLKSF